MSSDTPPVVTTRFVRGLVHVSIVLVVAVVFLLQPLPAVNRRWCPETIHVGRRLNYLLNFDSPVYLDIAEKPSRLFLDHGEWRSRRARPLYMLAAWALTGAFRDVPGLRRMNPHPSYPAFIVLNLTILVLSLSLFTAIVGTSRRAWVLGTLLGILLFSNDVAKVFVWTPHQQLFNIFEPLACAWLVRHTAERPTLSLQRLTCYGLAAGVLLLAYGSFVLLLAALLMGLFARWRRGESGRHLLAGGGLASLAFGLPVLAWILLVRHETGGFYVGETAEYRDFVWMVYAWRAGGARRLARVFVVFSADFLRTFGTEWVIPTFVVGAAVIPRVTAWEATREVVRRRWPTLVACFTSFALNLLFFWLMGNYAPRLSFNILPPLLAAAAVVVAGVTEERTNKVWLSLLATVALFVGLAHFHVIAKLGPWC